jgi:hypothetical protein
MTAKTLGVDRRLVMNTMAAPKAPPPKAIPRPIADVPMSAGDRLLLQGLARPETVPIWMESASRLPEGTRLSDLFEHQVTKELAEEVLETIRSSGRTWQEIHTVLQEVVRLRSADLPTQLRATLIEALIQSDGLGAGGTGIAAPQWDERAFKQALYRSVHRIWARFSQRIRAAISDAESRNDSVIQETLMKEYLDVQRKLKELTGFYE